jgi:DNA polymerase-3 subunit delta
MIKKESPPFTYKMFGPEPFFKDRVRQFAKANYSGFQIKERSLDDSPECLAQVRDLLFSENPFFDQKQLLILNRADDLKDLSVLDKYCDQPSSSRVLLLFSKDQSRIKKDFRNLETDQTDEAGKIKKYDLADWITSYAQQQGFSIHKRFAQAIVSNVGTDLYTIANELDKVFINHDGDGGPISQEDITSIIFQHEAVSQFDGIEKWGHKKRDQALRLITNHYENSSGDPSLKILASFFHHVQNLLYIASARRSGKPKKELYSALGKPPFIVDKLYKQASNWSPDELKNAYAELANIDHRIKTGDCGRLLIERFILSNHTD